MPGSTSAGTAGAGTRQPGSSPPDASRSATAESRPESGSRRDGNLAGVLGAGRERLVGRLASQRRDRHHGEHRQRAEHGPWQCARSRLLGGQPVHWLVHTAQWSDVRRRLPHLRHRVESDSITWYVDGTAYSRHTAADLPPGGGCSTARSSSSSMWLSAVPGPGHPTPIPNSRNAWWWSMSAATRSIRNRRFPPRPRCGPPATDDPMGRPRGGRRARRSDALVGSSGRGAGEIGGGAGATAHEPAVVLPPPAATVATVVADRHVDAVLVSTRSTVGRSSCQPTPPS